MVTIMWMRIGLEWNALIICSVSGAIGLVIGLEFVTSRIPPTVVKIVFVSVWASFAVALFIVNRQRKRATYSRIQNVKIWKLIVLFITGFLGGMLTSLAGAGVDACTFAVLTLLFQLSEKIATPTTLILMASNAAVGFYWRDLMQEGISDEAWSFLIVCTPITAIAAPVGSLLSSFLHRQTLAFIVYTLDAIALIGALIVLKPNVTLSCGSAGILVGGGLFFCLMYLVGTRIAKAEMAVSSPIQKTEGEDNLKTTTEQVEVAVIALLMNER